MERGFFFMINFFLRLFRITFFAACVPAFHTGLPIFNSFGVAKWNANGVQHMVAPYEMRGLREKNKKNMGILRLKNLS